jgi:hypothetical protein
MARMSDDFKRAFGEPVAWGSVAHHELAVHEIPREERTRRRCLRCPKGALQKRRAGAYDHLLGKDR